ncbi:MAG: sugar phosphate isomerase/epimerase [Clostridia bacterium]|nr:sugar phosphate isomerase/epimerase [Clostridia bacterium]
MKIASTTSDFRTIPSDDHLERVRHIAKAGFKYIDLSFYDIDKKNSPFMLENYKEYVENLKELANELGIKYVQAHLPNCNPLDEENFDEYLECTIRAIEICGMLGIENAVIHTGWMDNITKEQYFEMNLEALKPLFPAMEKSNVNVLIENSAKANMGNKYFFFTGADMKEFIEYVNHPLLHACWDLGHANIEGHQYKDIIALGDDLRALHVHDNYGKSDQHIALFCGTLNMDEVMTALIDINYKGYFTFEADNTISFGQTWQLKRRKFEKDTRLFNPSTEMLDAAEKFLFEIGKACLSAYGIYEE